MNITKETTGDLTATLKVEIGKDDYQEKVQKILKDYQRKANIPGFRPGKVPFGMVKKMYGRAVIADEVNNLLSENLSTYLLDNKINTLGNPLPNMEKTTPVDFERDEAFEFFFDIGIAPEFDVDLAKNITIEYYRVKPDKKMEEEYIDNIRTRLGTHSHPEDVADKDVVSGSITELDEKGEIKEEGVSNKTSIATDLIKDKKIKESFIGKKNGEFVDFNPRKAMNNDTEVSNMLGIKKEELDEKGPNFRFSIEEIHRQNPAELNEDLYKQAFGDECDTDKKFREKIRETIQRSLEPETDQLFMNMALEKLLKEVKFDLPEDFLKRLLKENMQENLTDEEFEKQFSQYLKSVRWQLIESKIARDKEIKVDENEIRDVIRNYFTRQMYIPDGDEESEQRLNGIVDSVMQNREETSKIHQQLFDNKMKDVLKENLKLKEKEVSYDEFIKLVTEKNKAL